MIFRTIARIYPKKIKQDFIENFRYLDYKTDAGRLIGAVVIISLIFSVAAALILSINFRTIPPYASWLIFFILIQILVYFRISLKVDAIARNVEEVLPDALQVISANLKAGLTVDQALLTSAKPEFGIFGKELDRIGKEITLGKGIDEALLNSAKRIKSEKYRKTIGLLVSGIRSGGRLAELLSQSSENLRQQKLVDEKIRSNVMMYVIFIFAAIALGAPVLFGLSSFLVKVLTSVFSQIDVPAASTTTMALPIISFSQMPVKEGFIMLFSLISLTVSGIMGGLIIGLITKGEGRYGMRYILPLIAISIAVFFISRLIIASILGGLMTI